MPNDIPDALFKRMVLANKYRILSHLDETQHAYWDRAASQAVEGWPIESLPDVPMILDYQSDALTKEDQHFVLDALNVFELLQDGIKKGYEPKRDLAWIAFPGFDGNHETKLLSYVRYAVEEERRFESIERVNADFNSHMPMAELYQRMITAWERSGRQLFINEHLFELLILAQKSNHMTK